MENASKALLIAAAVLIVILLIAFGMRIFGSAQGNSQEQVEQFKKMEQRKLPADINYDEISGLRIEARQKLNKIRPQNLGQASRISGVSPADVTVLIVWLAQNKKEN